MKRTIFLYGGLSGAVVICTMILGIRAAGVFGSEWVGYLIMLLALSVIFVGVKRYRDKELGGVIRFWTALLLGLGIALVAGVMYVAVWEIYLSATDYAFIDDYTRSVLAGKEAEGLAGAALEAEVASMDALKAQYANPIVRLPMTFLEIFPVGLLISLISAALLKNEKFAPA